MKLPSNLRPLSPSTSSHRPAMSRPCVCVSWCFGCLAVAMFIVAGLISPELVWADGGYENTDGTCKAPAIDCELSCQNLDYCLFHIVTECGLGKCDNAKTDCETCKCKVVNKLSSVPCGCGPP